MEIGIYTFGDVDTHPVTKEKISTEQRIKNLIEEAELADQVGLDVFAIGEHHRPDYSVSAPAIVLAAAAMKTKNIKLSSAVTVLSSDEPIRVFQQFATLDNLSGGRAEIMAGRGSFIESFPLFGYDLKDYDVLFTEKLQLLMKLNEAERISWQGKLTQAIDNRGVYPRPVQEKLPIWIAVGGTPESVVRAAENGLPMALAIIGGQPARFAPYTKLYRDVYSKAGHNPNKIQLSINSHTYIADDSKQAADELYAPYSQMMNRIGRERGWPPSGRAQFDASLQPEGALLVGSPQQVIDKVLAQYEIFGHTRYLAQISMGALPHDKVLRAIELLGTKVAPVVKKYASKQVEQLS